MGATENGSGGRKTPSEKNKRRQKRLYPVQILHETCKQVFADCGPHIVPSPENVQKLASVLDGITQEDVGLRPNMPFFDSARAPVITYMHIADCNTFSIGIFCLPPNSTIPLHDHPGMTVFSKLLFGTMHIKAYDWAEDLHPGVTDPKGGSMKLAKLKVNQEFTSPCKPSILYPNDGGNMHHFTAKTACAVLDVLGPPYSDQNGCHCQYYYEIPYEIHSSEVQEEEYAWLGEREKPEELCVVGVAYTGQRISTKRR